MDERENTHLFIQYFNIFSLLGISYINWLSGYYVADCEATQLGAVLGRVSNGIAGVSDSTASWDKVQYVAR